MLLEDGEEWLPPNSETGDDNDKRSMTTSTASTISVILTDDSGFEAENPSDLQPFEQPVESTKEIPSRS